MPKPNIVYVVIDSLRADHLGCYGYGKNTSPHIDALASESVRFERAFATGIPTMPSFTTALSGLHPYRHGITAHASNQRLSRDVVMLPQLAQAAGYTTIGIDNLAVQGSGRGSWFARGFDYYSGYLYKPFSDQSEQLVERAQGFLDEFKDGPFFLFLHLWDPHSPYGPPAPYDTMHYSGQPEAGEPSLAEVKALAPEYYESFLGDMQLKVQDDYGYVVAQYDGEISYVDSQVGQLTQYLKAQGLWDNTAIVLHSDHGECFGEGGVYFDHHGLYDAVTRVAMLMRVPGMAAGECAAMVTTEDIYPTLAELCSFKLPAYPLTGLSFTSCLSGGATEHRDEIFCVESTRQASLSLRTAEWKLIQPITEDAAGRPLVNIYGEPRSPAPLLFNLKDDPGEKRDVGDDFPEIRRQMSDRLQRLRAEAVAATGNDPVLEGLSLPYDDFMARLTSRKLRG